nr:putative integron gene cassette protein [uncultured bacterium]
MLRKRRLLASRCLLPDPLGGGDCPRSDKRAADPLFSPGLRLDPNVGNAHRRRWHEAGKTPPRNFMGCRARRFTRLCRAVFTSLIYTTTTLTDYIREGSIDAQLEFNFEVRQPRA